MSIKRNYFLLCLVPLYFMIMGLCLQPWSEIMTGLGRIMMEPDFLITDYFVIGGPGAAFVNASLVTLIAILILYLLKMNITGTTISCCSLVFCFSLFGKNLLNIWTILMGVFLYARYHRTSVKRYIYIGLYGTSLSPIITQIMQIGDLAVFPRLLLCIVIGNLIGFVLPPLATHVSYAHKGYSLYNVGFAAGIIATIVMSVFKSFGITVESRSFWATGYNQLAACMLGGLFLVMILLAYWHERKQLFTHYRALLASPGVAGTDYLMAFGPYTTLFSMAVNGLFATAFVLLVGGELNGPTIGSIMTVVGFGTTGKHLRNIAPIMMGVFLASLTKDWSIQDPSAMLALLLSTNLAPVAGKFGVIAGLIAGFLHSSVALNVSVVYSGMNLYNNGFAGGLVAMFLVPVIQSFLDRKARARGKISL